jgi:hypothetical protein
MDKNAKGGRLNAKVYEKNAKPDSVQFALSLILQPSAFSL